MRLNKFLPGSAVAALLCCILQSSPMNAQKQLTVYTAESTYSIAVFDQQGQAYIALIDLLRPLGTPDLHAIGKEWELKWNGIGIQLTEGKDKVRIQGSSIGLGNDVLT